MFQFSKGYALTGYKLKFGILGLCQVSKTSIFTVFWATSTSTFKLSTTKVHPWKDLVMRDVR